MYIGIVATNNLYPQLWAMIQILKTTQPNLEKIYAFVENDLSVLKINKVEFIDVSKFDPIMKNSVNDGHHWSRLVMTRCYFPALLPYLPKIIYLDLDMMFNSDISELWELDMRDFEVAGVLDSGYTNYNLPYLKDVQNYLNAGMLVMNLDKMRENGTDVKMDRLLHTQQLAFTDQDAINLCCKNKLVLDEKWNSSDATKISKEPKINHVIRVKPWDPRSVWFPIWTRIYVGSGAPFSSIEI